MCSFILLYVISHSIDLQSGKLEKFQALLSSANCSMKELEESSWHGIPPSCRATTWRLLCVSEYIFFKSFLLLKLLE